MGFQTAGFGTLFQPGRLDSQRLESEICWNRVPIIGTTQTRVYMYNNSKTKHSETLWVYGI